MDIGKGESLSIRSKGWTRNLREALRQETQNSAGKAHYSLQPLLGFDYTGDLGQYSPLHFLFFAPPPLVLLTPTT